jgi:hypothetical protein
MAKIDVGTIDMIRSKLAAGLVTYSTYDGNGRIIMIEEVPVYALHGDPSLVTELKYVGTTTSVLATKEYVGVWDASKHFDNL